MLTILVLLLYAIDSMMNLVGCWFDNKKLRTATKPLLMPLLLLYYIICNPGSINPFLISAIVACWLGDVLLMKRGNIWFAAGGIAFIIAHMFFILVYLHQTGAFHMSYMTASLFSTVYGGAIVIVACRTHNRTTVGMWISALCYLLCNAAMNYFALKQMLLLNNRGTIIAYIGAVLFFVSDCSLFIARFDKLRCRLINSYFLVMLTYDLGVLLITIGMTLVYQSMISNVF